jgi:hypothetical protein
MPRGLSRGVAEYRIPSDALVRASLSRLFSTRHEVSSQRQLKRLVERDLKSDEVFRVGEPRLRQIAIDSGLVDLEIHCRETGERRSLVKCPVCSERLRRVRNMTVFGGTVTVGYRCARCGYWTGLRKRVPTRYVFTRRA